VNHSQFINKIMFNAAVKIDEQMESAVTSVIDDIEYEPLKLYFLRKPQALAGVISLYAKSAVVANLTNNEIDKSLDFLFETRLRTISSVFIAECIVPKGEEHIRRFMELMNVDDTFTVLGYNIVAQGQALADKIFPRATKVNLKKVAKGCK